MTHIELRRPKNSGAPFPFSLYNFAHNYQAPSTPDSSISATTTLTIEDAFFTDGFCSYDGSHTHGQAIHVLYARVGVQWA